MYLDAEPILIDVDAETWQMDLDLLQEFLETETRVVGNECLRNTDNRVIRVLMPVHVLGNMCDMDRLMAISVKHHLTVIEDSTEALGSKYKGRSAGSFGIMNCFSFNGNKIISTGGGGVIVTNDEKKAKLAKHITTQAKPKNDSYYHDMVGYNFRMVNLLAAVGVAQMEQLDVFIARKHQLMNYYKNELSGIGDISFQEVPDDVICNGWLFTIKTERQRDLLLHLNGLNMISRAFWVPMSQLPMYEDCIYFNHADISEEIYQSCLSIPSSTSMTDEELSRVVGAIKDFFK
jgi:dTDP-4-amino-4,6-dideoxygalactose transaminase